MKNDLSTGSERDEFAAAQDRVDPLILTLAECEQMTERWIEALQKADTLSATRAAVLETAVRHVLRYGKLGKQSEARLRAALKAVEVSRG